MMRGRAKRRKKKNEEEEEKKQEEEEEWREKEVKDYTWPSRC